jgi:hypothetical protein
LSSYRVKKTARNSGSGDTYIWQVMFMSLDFRLGAATVTCVKQPNLLSILPTFSLQ